MSSQFGAPEFPRGKALGLTLHTLAHDYCTLLATDDNATWYQAVIDGYAKDAAIDRDMPSLIEETAWWADMLADDGYVHANLARHLSGAVRKARRS
jgi:hypothetical protein